MKKNLAIPSLYGALEQPDGLGIEDPGSNPLRRVEVDVGLVGVRIAEDASAHAVVDQIASLEVAKGDWHRVRGLAVDLFFVISGFVMARTYEQRMRDGLVAWEFIRLRYGRLWMPPAIGSSLGLVVVWLQPDATARELASIIPILFFMPAWWLGNAFLLNVPAWSLFLEISANAVHGALLGKTGNRRLLGLMLLCFAAFVVLFLYGLAQWGPGLPMILTLIPRALACYLAGILVYRRYGDVPLGSPWAIGAVPALLIAGAFSQWIELAAIAAFPLIVRASLGLSKAAWAMWIGALSYPMYATHLPVFGLAQLADVGFESSLLLALIIAGAVTILVEQPRLSRQLRPHGKPICQNEN